jgi:hypothetical protein
MVVIKPKLRLQLLTNRRQLNFNRAHDANDGGGCRALEDWSELLVNPTALYSICLAGCWTLILLFVDLALAVASLFQYCIREIKDHTGGKRDVHHLPAPRTESPHTKSAVIIHEHRTAV